MPKPLSIATHESFSAATGRQELGTPLDSERLSKAKIAFSCRRVPTDKMKTLVKNVVPRAGDLVLARVLRKRQHPRIELPSGRKASLFVGDEIVVCYGNRYATDQFEAVVPVNLEPCGLVASGGIAAQVLSRCKSIRSATEIAPIGLIADAKGRPLNLSSFSISDKTADAPSPTCLAVAGSSMNAGKTTSAAQLIRGLSKAGYKVGAAKVTGTGSGGDYWKLLDAGACAVVDFTDAGYASTFKVSAASIEKIVVKLTNHLQALGAQVVVLEIADGILQAETATLLTSKTMRDLVNGYLLAVADPLGAVAGSDWMARKGLPLTALCGTLTRSSLATREAAESTGLPILRLAELRSPEIASLLTSSGGELDQPATALAQ